MKPFITLCMIVKDEEKVLDRCLSSLDGLIDEIVIVDTGSTDNTKKISSKYTEYIYDFEWTNDFAEARNYALTKANGEWILILDADEYVESENLKEFINALKQRTDNNDAYEVKIYNFTGNYGEKIVQHKSARIFKNYAGISYSRAIHEQLVKKDSELGIGLCSLIIYHSGYLSKTVNEKNKAERNAALIDKEISISGNKAFDYFNLGNEYMGVGDTQKALSAYVKAYSKKKDFRYSWVSFCVIQIINCLIILKRYKDALKVIADAEGIYAQSPDFPCLKGHIYHLENRYDDAITTFESILNNKHHYVFPIASNDYLELQPHIFLGEIYKIKKNYVKAVFHYSSALNINPKEQSILYKLMDIIVKSHTDNEIVSFLNNSGWINSNSDYIRVVKVLSRLGSLNVINALGNYDLDEKYTKILQFKKSLLNKEKESASILLTLTMEELRDVFQEGFIDLYDMLICQLNTGEDKLNTLIDYITIDEKTKNFINFIIEAESKIAVETEFYLTLLLRCMKYNDIDLFEKLLQKVKHFDVSIHENIGNLLFENEFYDSAIDFYQVAIDSNTLESDSFHNVISYFEMQEKDYEALNFVFLAFEQGKEDFRIFKKGIDILGRIEEDEDREKFIFMALEEYPDSKWLRSMYIND